VLVLQSFRNSTQAVELINAGADDVLAKPVNMAEMAARLRGIARRINGHVSLSHAVGKFTYYFDGRMPAIDGKTVKVSRRERELLECLVLRQGRIVNRRFIYNYILRLQQQRRRREDRRRHDVQGAQEAPPSLAARTISDFPRPGLSLLRSRTRASGRPLRRGCL